MTVNTTQNKYYNPLPKFNYSYLTVCMKEALSDLDKYFTPFVHYYPEED